MHKVCGQTVSSSAGVVTCRSRQPGWQVRRVIRVACHRYSRRLRPRLE